MSSSQDNGAAKKYTAAYVSYPEQLRSKFLFCDIDDDDTTDSAYSDISQPTTPPSSPIAAFTPIAPERAKANGTALTEACCSTIPRDTTMGLVSISEVDVQEVPFIGDARKWVEDERFAQIDAWAKRAVARGILVSPEQLTCLIERMNKSETEALQEREKFTDEMKAEQERAGEKRREQRKQTEKLASKLQELQRKMDKFASKLKEQQKQMDKFTSDLKNQQKQADENFSKNPNEQAEMRRILDERLAMLHGAPKPAS